LDLSFDPGAGPNNGISHIVLQPDGKIIIADFFQTFNGVARSGIARLNSDGSLDTGYDPGAVISFNDNGGGGGSIYDLILQPDGKLVVFGQFFFIVTGPGTSV